MERLTRARKRRVEQHIINIAFNAFYVHRFLNVVRQHSGRSENVTVDDVLMGRVPEVQHLHVGWRNGPECVKRYGAWYKSPEAFLREALLTKPLNCHDNEFDDQMEIALFDPSIDREAMTAYSVDFED